MSSVASENVGNVPEPETTVAAKTLVEPAVEPTDEPPKQKDVVASEADEHEEDQTVKDVGEKEKETETEKRPLEEKDESDEPATKKASPSKDAPAETEDKEQEKSA